MLTLIDAGRFTSDGTAKKLELPAGADFMEVLNYTQSATTQTPGRGVRFEWQRSMDDGKGLMWTKQDGANAVDLEEMASGGFTLVNALPRPEAEKTGTAITAADPAVVTLNSHGYSNGDRIRIYGSTAMLQIAGMDFTIGNVTTNTFELLYLDASGFAAAATALKARRLAKEDVVDPAVRYIVGISQASEAVVTFSVDHNYEVDQIIRFRVDESFGMVEINELEGKVVSVDAANNTVTVDIDSSAFTAFAFPASSAGPFRFPNAAPAGHQEQYDASLAYQSGYFVPYMFLGAGADGPAGSDNDVIYWRAYRAERYQS